MPTNALYLCLLLARKRVRQIDANTILACIMRTAQPGYALHMYQDLRGANRMSVASNRDPETSDMPQDTVYQQAKSHSLPSFACNM